MNNGLALNVYLVRKYLQDRGLWSLDWDDDMGSIHALIYQPTLTNPVENFDFTFNPSHPPHDILVDHLFWRNEIRLEGDAAVSLTPDFRQILTLRRVCRRVTVTVDTLFVEWYDKAKHTLDALDACAQKRDCYGNKIKSPVTTLRRMRIRLGSSNVGNEVVQTTEGEPMSE